MTPNASTNCSANNPHPLRGYFYIAAAALCWSVSAILGRAVFTGRLLGGLAPIGPSALAQARATLSLFILAPILLAQRGRAAFRMSRGDLARAIGIGVLGLAGSNYTYYLAIQRTSVATAIILQYTAPIWVLLYMVARGLQRATAPRVISVALAVGGCALSIGVVGTRLHFDTLGVIAAELAGLFFAYYSIAVPGLLRDHDRWKVLLAMLLWASVFWIFVNPPWAIVAQHYSAAQWLFLLVFAIASGLVPFAFYIAGLHHLDATRAVVTSSLEPVFSIAIAAVALGEGVGPLQVVGIAIVLTATVLVQLPGPGEKAAVVEPIE